MKERNACVDAGCASACCYGSWFQDTYRERQVRHYFPTAKKVNYATLKDENLGPGVYYNKFLFWATIRIVGHCPNLGEANTCLIHDDLPPDCANLAISSEECSRFRRATAAVIPVEMVK